MVKQGGEMEGSAISSISSSVIKQEQEASSLSLVIKGVHLPILHIEMMSAVADDAIMLLPLNLEGVAGPGAGIDGEGQSLKGHGHIVKVEAAAVVGPPVVRIVPGSRMYSPSPPHKPPTQLPSPSHGGEHGT